MGRKTNQYGVFIQSTPPKRKYGCLSLLLDVFMTILTQGFWVIWIIIRQWRNRNGN